MKPLKLFVSMPMNGKTEQEIAEQMQQAHKDAERITHTPLVLLDTVFDLPEDAKPLDYIGESIKKLAEADVAYFCDGWEQARGCRIEWMCARDYGVDRIDSLESVTRLVHCPTCGNLLGKDNDVPRWISVEERLPEKGMVVLVRWHGEMAFARYTPHRLGWYNLDTRYDSPNAVSHWMPLPPMPKED